MSHKDGRVVLSAWVDPVLRDYVREAARSAVNAGRAAMRRARVINNEFVQSNECERNSPCTPNPLPV